MSDAMDHQRIADYLERLGCPWPATADAGFLARVHRAHLRRVPFENLDIHLGLPIELDVDGLYDKIVRRRRGGFCYELNGLFAELLRSLGYDVELMQARVVGSDGALGIPFDHLCLRVLAPEPMLADVGFGASFVEPLRLDTGDDQADETGTYTVAAGQGRPTEPDGADDDWWALRRDGVDSYQFSTRPRELLDFTPGSRHHQTSPDSHFTRNTVCSRLTVDGRLTLRGRTLITTVDGRSERRDLERLDEMVEIYRRDLGVELDVAQYELLWHLAEPSVQPGPGTR